MHLKIKEGHTRYWQLIVLFFTDFCALFSSLCLSLRHQNSKLEGMGMHVLGDYNSPVIPAVIYVPAKLSAFSKECYERGLAVSRDMIDT